MTLGCGSTRDEVELDVFSWWEQRAESFAFESVIEVHRRRHEHVTVENVVDRTSTDARETLARRLLLGDPPATFQANIGADVLSWTAVDSISVEGETLQRASYVEGLSALFDRMKLEEKLPRELLDALRVGSSRVPYAVPINIHRLNVLYYNARGLDESQVEQLERTFQSSASLCPPEGAAAESEPGFSIAIGTGPGETFVLPLLTFENVLPALTNAEYYDDLFSGKIPTSGSVPVDWTVDVRRALECVQHLSKRFVRRENWSLAVEAVERGEADLTIMGDWANGQLSAALREGTVRALPFPGTADTFVFTSDTFPLPVGVEHRAEAEALLETIASVEAQRAFSQEKGSIPARDDVELDGLGPYAQATREAFRRGRRVLATSGRFPRYYPLSDLDQKLRAMTGPRAGREEVDAALAEFIAAQPLLMLWHDRLAQLAAASVEP